MTKRSASIYGWSYVIRNTEQTCYDGRIHAAIDNFRPTGSRDQVDKILPKLREWAHRSPRQRNVNNTTEMCSALATYLLWTQRVPGVSLDDDAELLSIYNIERFVATETRLAPITRSNYRAHLRHVYFCIFGEKPPPTYTALQASARQRPYDAAEQGFIKRLIGTRRTAYANYNIGVLIALGLGGGLPAEDIIGLRGDDVFVTRSGLAMLRLWNVRRREVVLRPEWSPYLIEAKRLYPHSFLFRPRREAISKNCITKFTDEVLASGERRGGPALTTQRMRVTWLCYQIERNLPLTTLLAITGIQHPDGLQPYMDYVRRPSRSEVLAGFEEPNPNSEDAA